jgi:hypothetical protein
MAVRYTVLTGYATSVHGSSRLRFDRLPNANFVGPRIVPRAFPNRGAGTWLVHPARVRREGCREWPTRASAAVLTGGKALGIQVPHATKERVLARWAPVRCCGTAFPQTGSRRGPLPSASPPTRPSQGAGRDTRRCGERVSAGERVCSPGREDPSGRLQAWVAHQEEVAREAH